MARSKAYKAVQTEQERLAIKRKLDAELQPRVTRSRLVRMFPTPKQHAWLVRWMKDTRRTYNLAMAIALKRENANLTQLEVEISKTIVAEKGIRKNLRARDHKMLRTPKVLRQQAVKSVMAVWKGHHTRVAKQAHMHQKYPKALAFQRPVKFNPGFKSRRLATDSFSVEIKSLRLQGPDKCSLYRTFNANQNRTTQPNTGPGGKDYVFRSIQLEHDAERIQPTQDFKVHYRYGKWFLILPNTQKPKTQMSSPEVESVLALDPGVRTFLTGYSPEGTIEEIGTNTTKVLDKLSRRIQRTRKRVRSFVTPKPSTRKAKAKWRNSIWRRRVASRAAEDTASRTVRDLHYKAAHYLLHRYRHVILPHTSSHGWNVNKVVRRQAQMLRFGAFAERLVQTATQYPGRQIRRGSEAYTSMQCGWCGFLHRKLGDSKTFKCPKCGFSMERDVHGARNILLRLLEDDQ